ncbi:MAG: hypothetical protein F4000_16235, partial [Holophagales bacterium]|nr:hypothetical protein [Holophagales bacterium]
MAVSCLIPTAVIAATLDGGFDVSVRSGNVEARVVEVGLGSDMELFYFDTSHDPEVLVKVLDGCAVNGHRWVAVAAATDRQLDVIVQSRTSGAWQYRAAAGHPSQSRLDTAAFPCTASNSTSVEPATKTRTAAPSSRGSEPKHVAAAATLNSRFVTGITVTHDGSDYGGVVTDLPGDSAVLFWFFDPSNPEVLFRVVDGCSLNGHWWVFMAVLTDLPGEATVQDTATGSVKRYTLSAGSHEGVADRTAFSCDAGTPT